ncbi:lycopene beta-cyclase CrtY [Xanthobacter sp. DSM 24535]|uniref:lycopene beta-cyclase CrtY n=1 Tax=Roseixanthobacter psychrophilus TaxID=3119917 RepID=UPI00372825D1
MDMVLVGGGLANVLLALRLRQARPDLRLAILEAGPRIGGNHTWSFHETDVTPAQFEFLAPLLTARWRGHSVRFPARRRALEGAYASIASHKLEAIAHAALGSALRTNARVAVLHADHVVLKGGETIHARAVVDGRGPGESAHLDLGYQKFLGLEVRLAAPHGLSGPVIMDATVSQLDGYRFVYLLPFTADTVLIEDTYYADGPGLDPGALRARILAYAHAQGWHVEEVIREEEGVLPIALGGNLAAFWNAGTQGVVRSGLRAALFHPTTGYSLPDAMALADMVAESPDISGPALAERVRQHAFATWERRGYFRLLNRMLFRAAAPDQRYTILQRFYGLPEPLIARFYAGRLTLADKARILTGRPPVPLGAALRCLPERT